MTTPDEKWLYWNPGEPLPEGEVTASEYQYDYEWCPGELLPQSWSYLPRRYKLSPSKINISDIKVGDMVVLKPVKVSHVFPDGELKLEIAGSAYVRAEDIKRVIPAPAKPLKVGDRVRGKSDGATTSPCEIIAMDFMNAAVRYDSGSLGLIQLDKLERDQ